LRNKADFKSDQQFEHVQQCMQQHRVMLASDKAYFIESGLHPVHFARVIVRQALVNGDTKNSDGKAKSN
jgi:hypothetical protein